MSHTMIERHYANVAGSPFTVSRTMIERHYANVAGSQFTVSRTIIERHYANVAGSQFTVSNVAGSQFTVSRTMIEMHYANVAGSHFTVFRPMIDTHCSLSHSASKLLHATLAGVDRGLLNHLRAACLAADHRADYHANVHGSQFTVFRPMIDTHCSLTQCQ